MILGIWVLWSSVSQELHGWAWESLFLGTGVHCFIVTSCITQLLKASGSWLYATSLLDNKLLFSFLHCVPNFSSVVRTDKRIILWNLDMTDPSCLKEPDDRNHIYDSWGIFFKDQKHMLQIPTQKQISLKDLLRHLPGSLTRLTLQRPHLWYLPLNLALVLLETF